MKKKLTYLCILSLLSVLLLAGCGNKEKNENPNYNSDNYLSGTYYALMDVDYYGEIYLELNADAAPATVTNFVNLAKEGFYDGLTFHRIVDGFMIQGGDPEGTGLGGSTYTIPGEFSINGYENSISHVRGTISMARASNDYDSATSQFFIVQEDATGLDGYYAGFGKVVSGMDIVDAICDDVMVEDDNGTVLAENQPVITSITIIEKEDVFFDESETSSDAAEPELPNPVAEIQILTVTNPEDAEIAERWVIDENGGTYLLTSSADLLSLSLYQIDLTEGFNYGEYNMIAYSSDIGANTYISLQINITLEGLPNQLLIAEEHSGALSMYLLSYDENINAAYLVPFMY